MSFLDDMLYPKQNKEANLVSQGTDKEDHFDRKVIAHPWVNDVLSLDPVQVEAEYQTKLKQEAMTLGKTAALDDVIADGTTPEEVVNRDYKRDVSSLSDYALSEMLAEAWGHKAQNTSEMFYELKEKAKKEVASSREKAEKALLEMIPENSQLDWQKAFKEFTKDATPAEPKEKDLFKSEVPEAPHNFDKPSEEKFKLPKDPEKALPGNGREADERTDVVQEAGVLKADIVEGTSKEASLKVEAHCGSCPGDPGMEQKGAPEEIEKDAASNDAVIQAFISGQGGANSMNLHIVQNKNGLMLVNYQTPIAFKSEGGDLFLNADKYSVTTSKIQNQIAKASGGKIKHVSAAELDQIMKDPAASAAPAVEPAAEKTADGPSASDNCPVCGQAGKDLMNGAKENIACEACGITYACASLTASAEIETHASKVEVIKKVAELQKKAEVSSPWIVTTDEHGQEILARVEQPTNVKESEEDKKEEILK
jgi:transcription elongation factor Elf1